jgi:hypothetical protein
MTSVFVATPMYGGLCYGGYMVGMLSTLDVLKDNNIKLYYSELCNESLITRGRNRLVRNFLQTDAEYLLFIDADIFFSGKDVLKILSHEKDIVCALYPKKMVEWDLVKKAVLDGEKNLQDFSAEYVVNLIDEPSNIDLTGLAEIKHGGTGFMCIRRNVFETLADKVPSYRESTLTFDDPEKNQQHLDRYPVTKDFFALSIDDGGLYLSEDYHFCNLWRKNGGKIYADLSIELKHIGTHVFSGSIQHCLIGK